MKTFFLCILSTASTALCASSQCMRTILKIQPKQISHIYARTMSHVPATTTFNAEDKAIVTRESTTMREWVNKMPLDDLHKLNNLYFREKLLQQKNFRLQSTIENLEQKSLTAFSTNISVPEALIGSCIAGPHIYIIGKLICYSAWNTYFMFRTNQQHRAEKNLHRTQKTIQDLEQKLSSIMKERPQ